MPKKPYKIKFDSKQNFLGMGKAKNWVLLANYGDPSSMRSQFAYSSAKLMDSTGDFAVDTKLVEVKLNGNYIGLYNLTEAVEVNSNRVDIDDNVDNIDTGYLLELDKRAPEEGIENKDYIVVGGKNYAFKDPDPDDDLKPEQIEYIKSYLTRCYEVVCENSYEEVCEYLDVETFASEYVVQELLKSNDVGGLSFYFYKDAGGKLCNGPAWDFDIAMGNCRDSISVNPDCMYVRLVNKWYSELLKFEDFRTLVSIKLENSKDALRENIQEQTAFAFAHSDAFYRNYNVWKTIGEYVWPSPRTIADIKTWEGNIEYVDEWLKSSLFYLEKEYLI